MTGAIACGLYSLAPTGTVQLHNQTVSKSGNGSETATYTINSSGNAVGSPGGTLEAWLIGIGAAAASYEVMATVIAGEIDVGSVTVWLNCGTSRAWSVTNDSLDNSTRSGVITVQIRDVGTHTVLASASITLNAVSNNRFG